MSVMLPPIAVALRASPSAAAMLLLPSKALATAGVAQDDGEVAVAGDGKSYRRWPSLSRRRRRRGCCCR